MVELKKASEVQNKVDGIVCVIRENGTTVARCYSIEQGKRGARYLAANPGDYAGLRKALLK